MRIHLPHLFSKWRYCGWCGEKSWAWIWHQKSTLKVWTCLLLKFKCKFCREKVTKTRLKYVSCRLVPRVKCGSIKSEVSLWLSSYQLWYQMKVAVISAELRFAKLSPEKWLLVSDTGLSLLACTQLFNYWVSNFKAEQRLWWLQVHVIVGSGWGVSYSLCVAVCARSVPLRHFRLSQLCTNSPPGSSGLSHLLSACWASSNLAASDGATGALGVSSPQDCQKSSVKSPYRLALQAPRKLTRRRDGGRGRHWLRLLFSIYAATVLHFHKTTSSKIPASGHFICASDSRGGTEKWNGLRCAAPWQLTSRALYFLVLFPGALSSE